MAPKWDARVILDFDTDKSFTCVGVTKKGFRCRNTIAVCNQLAASHTLDLLSCHDPLSKATHDELDDLAYFSLCVSLHRKEATIPGHSQHKTVVRNWKECIDEYVVQKARAKQMEDEKMRRMQHAIMTLPQTPPSSAKMIKIDLKALPTPSDSIYRWKASESPSRARAVCNGAPLTPPSSVRKPVRQSYPYSKSVLMRNKPVDEEPVRNSNSEEEKLSDVESVLEASVLPEDDDELISGQQRYHCVSNDFPPAPQHAFVDAGPSVRISDIRQIHEVLQVTSTAMKVADLPFSNIGKLDDPFVGNSAKDGPTLSSLLDKATKQRSGIDCLEKTQLTNNESQVTLQKIEAARAPLTTPLTCPSPSRSFLACRRTEAASAKGVIIKFETKTRAVDDPAFCENYTKLDDISLLLPNSPSPSHHPQKMIEVSSQVSDVVLAAKDPEPESSDLIEMSYCQVTTPFKYSTWKLSQSQPALVSGPAEIFGAVELVERISTNQEFDTLLALKMPKVEVKDTCVEVGADDDTKSEYLSNNERRRCGLWRKFVGTYRRVSKPGGCVKFRRRSSVADEDG